MSKARNFFVTSLIRLGFLSVICSLAYVYIYSSISVRPAKVLSILRNTSHRFIMQKNHIEMLMIKFQKQTEYKKELYSVLGGGRLLKGNDVINSTKIGDLVMFIQTGRCHGICFRLRIMAFENMENLGSLAHFTLDVTGLTLSVSFICGKAEMERTSRYSQANMAVSQVMAFEKRLRKLTICLTDITGTPLTQDKIANRYPSKFRCFRKENSHDECYPHCHCDTTFTERNTIDNAIVNTECREIVKFLKENVEYFHSLEELTFICCHGINIPDDLAFMLDKNPKLKLIKVDENYIGPVFDLSEPGSFHGYTPWKYTTGEKS